MSLPQPKPESLPGAPGRFATTHWSLVVAAQGPGFAASERGALGPVRLLLVSTLPGYYSNSNPDGSDSGPGWGWAAYLLDDLEQDPLQKQIDFTRDISDPVNAAARTTVLPIYLCPANPAATTFTVNDANGQPLCDVARGSYIAVNGNDGVSDYAADNDGAFVGNQRYNMSAISDGLSSTLFIGERSTSMSGRPGRGR